MLAIIGGRPSASSTMESCISGPSNSSGIPGSPWSSVPNWTSGRAQPSTAPIPAHTLPTGLDARTHSVPVRADSRGQLRCDPPRATARATSICSRQSHTARPGVVASQAESASSILVTRSMRNPQVRGPGVLCCLVQLGGPGRAGDRVGPRALPAGGCPARTWVTGGPGASAAGRRVRRPRSGCARRGGPSVRKRCGGRCDGTLRGAWRWPRRCGPRRAGAGRWPAGR
jgi:hypothetical protein